MKTFSNNQNKLLNKLRHTLDEGTRTRGSSGSYAVPMQPGMRLFNNKELGPFIIPTSEFVNAELAYDSYDDDMEFTHDEIEDIENKSREISIFNREHPVQNDGDGDILNNNVIIEPIEESNNFKFSTVISILYPVINKFANNKGLSKSEVVKLVKNGDNTTLDKLRGMAYGSHMREAIDKIKDHFKKNVNEDLAVWFGTKKKPKGSKQPKGPWVNICKKVDGKHPPCGRPDADTKSYPKCRAAGVAGKMSDSEKKAACSQKRRAEKKEPKYGKGNKPTMTSYKPKNESYLDDLIRKILQEEIFKNY